MQSVTKDDVTVNNRVDRNKIIQIRAFSLKRLTMKIYVKDLDAKAKTIRKRKICCLEVVVIIVLQNVFIHMENVPFS